MIIKYFHFLFVFAVLIFSLSCCDDDGTGDFVEVCDPEAELLIIDYNPESYNLVIPVGFQPVEQPVDNELTVDGVLLGRHLFYDPILSADSTMSCSSCHKQNGAFTDNLTISTGIDGIAGKRSSMSLMNLIYNPNGFFWDGRSSTLEDQALLPVEDPIELHNNWDDLIEKLKCHEEYPAMFRKAFGITNKTEITKELAAKAIAQFERTLINSGSSKFDSIFLRQEGFFSDAEVNGYDIFFDTSPDLPDGQCGHCHAIPLFTENEYRNNGLDEVSDLEDFVDKGRGEFTGNKFDNGKFRTPSLINWEFNAPYMHDGRFATIDEVLDHYISGIKESPNKDPLMENHDDPSKPDYIDENHRADLLAFLKTLTDTTFIKDKRYSNPFN